MIKRTRVQAAAGMPALRDAAAAASSGGAADAAHLALAAGGSAADAVVAGFFAAAGADPSVLLGATSAIVASSGSGVRAFDGRPLQPGKGAQRPRGFVDGMAIPDAARIAVPRAVPMLLLLHAYGGRGSLSHLARYGAEAALAVDAKLRAGVLRRVGAAGALALRTEGVQEALLAAGNSVAGGSLTEADFESLLPADAEAQQLFQHGEDAVVSGSPWAEGGESDGDFGWVVDVIVAADSRGSVAAFAYASQPKGIDLPSVELTAPRVAVPVRRGVTRCTPGVALRAPAPIGVARFGRDLALAFGLSGRWEAGATPLFQTHLEGAALAPLSEGAAVETVLAGLARVHGAPRSVAAVRSPKTTRSTVVVPDATAPASSSPLE